jgi:hypothetical protein
MYAWPAQIRMLSLVKPPLPLLPVLRGTGRMETAVLLADNFVCSAVAHQIVFPARMDIRYQSASAAIARLVLRGVKVAPLQAVPSVFITTG